MSVNVCHPLSNTAAIGTRWLMFSALKLDDGSCMSRTRPSPILVGLTLQNSHFSFKIRRTRTLPLNSSSGRRPTKPRWTSRRCPPPSSTRTTRWTSRRQLPLQRLKSSALSGRVWPSSPAMWLSSVATSAMTSGSPRHQRQLRRPCPAAGCSPSAAAASTSPAPGGWRWSRPSTRRSAT